MQLSSLDIGIQRKELGLVEKFVLKIASIVLLLGNDLKSWVH